MRNENPFDRRRDLEVPYYTVYHRFGGRRFVCFGFDPASAMVQKLNTRNVYLRTDDKRCIMFTTPAVTHYFRTVSKLLSKIYIPMLHECCS